MASSTRIQLENWLKTIHVPDNSFVVDIGGAQKPVIKRLGSSGKDSVYKILDIANPHENSPTPDIIGNIESVGGISENTPRDFDVAFCLEVAEYWTDPTQAIKNIHKLLKHSGTLYISFNFIYPHHKPDPFDSLRYTKWGAERLLKNNGFKDIEIVERVTENSSMRKIYEAERMHWDRVGINPEFIGCLIKATKI